MMKRFTLVIAPLVVLGLSIQLLAQGIDADLQRAIQKEVASGDLRAAIADYDAIIARAGSNRAVAAEALLHQADAYQRLGDVRARPTLERIVEDYKDQPELAAAARARIQAPPALSYTLVWNGPDTDSNGGISNDGRHLSFTNWGTGNLEIRDLAQGSNRALTNEGTWNEPSQWAEGSAISRDGGQVAYAWFNTAGRYELRVVSTRGNGIPTPRRLYDNPTVSYIGAPDWSPDGQWIAVQVERTTDATQVALVSTQDGRLTVLYERRGDVVGTGMAFSPDGQYLAFSLAEPGSRSQRIHIVPAKGGDAIQVANTGSSDRLAGWSPDGRQLVFVSDRRGSNDVWAVPMSGGRPSGAPAMLKAGLERVTFTQGITASGALFVSTVQQARDIVTLPFDLAAGKATAAPTKLAARFEGSNIQPDWAPDGNRIAYVSLRSDRPVLVIRDVASGTSVEHRVALQYFQVPRWAPDGRTLLVQGTDDRQQQGIFRIDATSGAVTPVVTGAQPGFGHPQWHPDGRRIYYRQRIDGNAQLGSAAIVERDLTTGATRELIRKPAGLRALDVDRQGRNVVAVWQEGEASVVGVIPTASGDVRELHRVQSPVGLEQRAVAWTPDGAAVIVRAFQDGNPGRTTLYLLPLDGSPIRTLALGLSSPTSPTSESSIRVRPDGRALLFVDGRNEIEVWSLENFLPRDSGR